MDKAPPVSDEFNTANISGFTDMKLLKSELNVPEIGVKFLNLDLS